MEKIIFNTRDQLTVIYPDLVAAAQADGNYSRVLYINKRVISLTVGISKLEEMLKANAGRHNRFIRLGRSFIINHSYLYKIDLQKQLIVLSDGSVNELCLTLSKNLVKSYKDVTVQSVKIKKQS